MTTTEAVKENGTSAPKSDGASTKKANLDVAVVGGGIIGVMTALGLVQRGLNVKIYERAPSWHEIGAGIGFTRLARECMERIHPGIFQVMDKICEKTSASTHTRYWDGFHPRTKEEAESEKDSLLFEVPVKDHGFWACMRQHLLEGMAKYLPEGVACFGKELVRFEDEEGSDKVVLHFADGSTAEADVVIGCDGIHSATRLALFGADNPASYPSYQHTVCYRTMVPIAAGISALGEVKARSGCMHTGPGANMMTYPVLNSTLFNIALWVHEDEEFPDPIKMITPGTREDIARALEGWGPHMTDIVNFFPEKVVKWGIFDTAENPAPTYAVGRVCLAGDAAHASSPFQGLGACMGVEDALALVEAVDMARTLPDIKKAVREALQAYSNERIGRSQWLVRSSREMGDMYQWRLESTGHDGPKCKARLEENARKIWSFDIDKMVADTKARITV